MRFFDVLLGACHGSATGPGATDDDCHDALRRVVRSMAERGGAMDRTHGDSETRLTSRAAKWRRHGRRAALALLIAPWSGATPAQAPDPDLNDDGTVDIVDLGMVSTCLGQPPAGSCAIADTDGDGDVDMDDLNYVLASFGQTGFPVGGGNQAPVADAGPDQSVALGGLVSLSASGSSDPDGDPLQYRWSFQVRPPGSAAVLQGDTTLTPGFRVDAAGTYVVQLVVNDGSVDSALDIAVITTLNSAPVADAGADQSVAAGDRVTLDGSGSSDADGDLLRFSWRLVSVPAGSGATLSDPSAVAPTFLVDVAGDYVAELVVNDGTVDSAPDEVTVSSGNSPPSADAGPDQSVLVNDLVTLDGSGSTDPDGDTLTFAWAITGTPALSAATLSDPGAVAPTFTVDRPGDYVVQLVVNDGLADSAADTVVISTTNSAPVADAGPDVTARVGDTVQLDASASSDADFDTLSFRWAVTSRPALSNAGVSDPGAVQPTLLIDRPGVYVVSLVVNDASVDSAPDSMTVTTVNSRPVADAGEDQQRSVGETVELDGSGSSDADFDALAFRWSLTAVPPGSTAGLSGADGAAPTLVPDALGTYVAQLVVNDGTVDSAADTVTIEVGPPGLELLATPVRGNVPLQVSFATQVTGGFPPFTYAWDVDGDGSVDDTRPGFVQLYQQGGSVLASVSVADSRGFVVSDTQLIEALVAPQVVATGVPTEGTAPLDVAFSAVASDADGAVVLYEWDFNGDGSADQVNPSSGAGAFRYDTPGRYLATLTVTDDDGNTASDTVVVSVGLAPELQASATPLTGDAPLEVSFSATATDPDGVVVRYEWDFESDGVVDYTDPAVGNTTHTYDTGGIFPATVSVFDDTGLIATRTFVVSVAGPPVALPRAFPVRGRAPLTVTFFSDGADIDGSPEFYDWDFNGDGRRDRRLIASMNTTFTYTAAGTYQARLTVVDDDGLTGSATVAIQVEAPDPAQGDPVATALARPPVGGAPLDTSLIGEGDTPSGSIVEFAWDFEGDGVFDFVDPVRTNSLLGSSIDAGSRASPALLDVDGDGDRDLLVGNSVGQVQIYVNGGTVTDPAWTSAGPLTDDGGAVVDVGSNASIALDDIDADGDQDLLIGTNLGQILVVENISPDAVPVWAVRGALVNAGAAVIDVGTNAAPLPIDYDADGDRDLLVGDSAGRLRLLRRGGTATGPTWTDEGLISNDAGAVIDIGSSSAPLLLPALAPALPELLVGDSFGRLWRFVNTGSAAGPPARSAMLPDRRSTSAAPPCRSCSTTSATACRACSSATRAGCSTCSR